MITDKNRISLSALKITLIYLVIAGLWIAFTDQLLNAFVSDPAYLSTLQTYKGWFYVLVTATGLYWLIHRHSQELSAKQQELTALINELQSEKELTDKLFERIPVLITVYDPQLNEFQVNREFERVLGWTNKEITSQEINPLEACYPGLEVQEEAVEFMKNPGVGWKEFSMVTRNGEEIPTSWTNIKLTDDTSVGIGIDMSEIKASQAKIRESRQLLKKIFESLKSSLIVVDPQNRTIVDCNQATREIFGYEPSELIGQSTRMLHVNEEHYQQFDEIGKEDLANNGVFQTGYEMQRKDGTVFYSDHTVTLVFDEEDNVDKVVSVIRDITEQKQYEQQLKQNRERLLKSQQIGNIGDWEFDPQNEEIYWSPTMYDIYERDPELGPPEYEAIRTAYYGDDAEKHNRKLKEALEKGEPYDIDLQLKTEQGNKKYIHAIGIPVTDDENRVTKLRGVVQDITGRKRTQIELQQRNTFIETTLENLPVGVAVNTIDDGKATFMNDKFSEVYGWPKEVLEDVESFFELVYPDEDFRAAIKQQVMEDMESGDPERMRWKGIPITTQEGEERFVDNTAIPLYEQNLMISTVVDVTEQKKLEQELRKNEERLQAITNNIPGVVFRYEVDADGNEALHYISEGAEEIWGLSAEEAKRDPNHIWDQFPDNERQKVQETINESAENLTNWDVEWRYVKPDGTECWHHGIGIPNKQQDGSIIWDSIIIDITEQKKTQEKIIQSVIEGEDRERRRIARELHDGLGQYLVASNMNFESVKGQTDQLPEKRQQQFQTGLSLLKDALSETRSIAHNLMPKAIADYGLVAALQNLLQNLRDSTDINFEFKCNCENLRLHDQAETNIYRILQEAIINAVRHADCDNIFVRLMQKDNTLQVAVEDDGKGAEPEESNNGVGLGLKSIQTRVNSLNGTVDLYTAPGEGLEINITIPNLNELINDGDA